MNAAAKIGLDHYIAQGLTRIQAAAVIGAFIVESNLNPRARGDLDLAQQAHGIGQWRGDRWRLLQAYARSHNTDPYDYLTQLDYALVELTTTEKIAGDKLFSSDTLEEAVEAMVDFERPAGWTKKFPRDCKTWKKRLRAARLLV